MVLNIKLSSGDILHSYVTVNSILKYDYKDLLQIFLYNNTSGRDFSVTQVWSSDYDGGKLVDSWGGFK